MGHLHLFGRECGFVCTCVYVCVSVLRGQPEGIG